MAVSGKLDKDAPGPEKRNDDNLEPVFYHAIEETLVAELVHTCSPKKPALIIDLTPGGGTLCLHALKHRIPCLAFPFNEVHAKLLLNRLTKIVFDLMATDGNRFHDLEVSSIMAGGGDDADEDDGENPKPKPKAKSKSKGQAKPKAKGKAKGKAASAASADGEGDGDEEEAEEEDCIVCIEPNRVCCVRVREHPFFCLGFVLV